MKALVIGGDSMLGSALARSLNAPRTSRREGAVHPYDLRIARPFSLPDADVVYLVAAITKFRECELDKDAYAVNVDAQVAIAAHFRKAHIVYLSSEAAEWPNQTAYGSQKRACEMNLLAACGYDRLAVVRPKRIAPTSVPDLCRLLTEIGTNRSAGVFRWEAA